MTDSDTPLPRTEPPSAIRVFLIAEVRDYTTFSLERGDEAATRLVERFAGLTRRVVESRGGRVLELRGDEALAVFDTTRQALRTAVELQARYLEEMERDPSLPLRVGIGLDAGEAVPFEGGYRGRALNLAARLKDQARAGQVLASEALLHLAGQVEGLVYVERGLVHPKGFALPVRIVQVVAEGQQPLGVEYADEPEVRTFLFTDIHGYIGWMTEQGDAAAVEFRSWYTQLIEEQIRANAGRVLEATGDEAFAVFVSPRQAIQAALDLQERFQQVVEVERRLPLTLGIGLETGEAIPAQGTYVGTAVNQAALICGQAGHDEVLIGETIFRLVRSMSGLRFVDRGEVAFRSFSEPLRIRQVVRADVVNSASSTDSVDDVPMKGLPPA